MVTKKKKRKPLTAGQILCYILVTLTGFIMFYPFWYVVVYSLSSYSSVIGKGAILWPQGFTLEAIQNVLQDPDIYTAYGNTLFLAIGGTFFSLLATLLFAYPLSCHVAGHRVISFLVYFTMLFSGGMLPTYYVVRSAGLLDSLWSLILPVLINPFYVFLVRNFFEGVPEQLKESAFMDGAGQYRTFFSIMLPLSMAVIASMTLFYAVGYWNSYFSAILYIRSPERRPLQLILREMISSSSTEELAGDFSASDLTPTTLKMATLTVSVIPIICVYPFLQKFFEKGVMIGALKG